MILIVHDSLFLYSYKNNHKVIQDMQAIARRFFATEAAAELEKTAAEKATQLQKLFSEQCATIMKTRGHHKLEMGTVVSKNGSEMKFDFTYGWPIRYYCVCNMGEETVTKEAMKNFEQSLKNVGVNPNHGVYFSKAAYEGNPEELRVLFIDPKLLEKMNLEGSSRKVTQYKVMFFCVLAMSYLTWTFFSYKNPQRRRLVERWHRYVLKDNKTSEELYPEEPEKKHRPILQKATDAKASSSTAAAAAASIVAEVEEEKKKEEEEEAKLTPIVDPSLLKDQTMDKEEEEEEGEENGEEGEEEKKEGGESAGGMWESISSTFWWLLGYKN